MSLPARPRVLAIIPARGGSKGIPRKNIRSLGGKPLLSYAIGNALASRYAPDVVVSSDDQEIQSLAAALGARVHRRSASLAADTTTLDAVVAGIYPEISAATGNEYDIVVTLQPTSPLMLPASLDAAIDQLITDPSLDTVFSAGQDAHLRWRLEAGRYRPSYVARVNRQQLEPTFRETGGLIACRAGLLTTGTRIGSNVALQVLSGAEAIDIDSPDDWALCEWYLARRDVVFVVAGNPTVGLGHVYNALTVANELVRHRIRFLVTTDSELAADVVARHHYEVQRQTGDLVEDILATGADVVVNDRLDTSAGEIARLKAAGRLVINFEDLGDGAREADLVINAIYPEREALPRHHFGPRFFCLRSQFTLSAPPALGDTVRSVLLAFGGTDPSDATLKVATAIAGDCRARGIELTVVAGLGYPSVDALRRIDGIRVAVGVADMADRIASSDLVFTSAGRTVFEVAAMGRPAIVLAQNPRELTHFFASEEHGFLNLGLASEVSRESIREAFRTAVEDSEWRRRMHRRMLDNELRTGTARVAELIEATIGGAWASPT